MPTGHLLAGEDTAGVLGGSGAIEREVSVGFSAPLCPAYPWDEMAVGGLRAYLVLTRRSGRAVGERRSVRGVASGEVPPLHDTGESVTDAGERRR